MRIPIGAIIVGSFAIIWTAAGASNMARRWLLLAVSSSALISAVIIFAAWHIQPGQPVQFNLKAYNISVAFEAILIAITIIALTRTGRKFLLLPAISIIVGRHFYGMTWALGSNEYWWIGTAMWLLPIVTLAFCPVISGRRLSVGNAPSSCGRLLFGILLAERCEDRFELA